MCVCVRVCECVRVYGTTALSYTQPTGPCVCVCVCLCACTCVRKLCVHFPVCVCDPAHVCVQPHVCIFFRGRFCKLDSLRALQYSSLCNPTCVLGVHVCACMCMSHNPNANSTWQYASAQRIYSGRSHRLGASPALCTQRHTCL